MAFVSAVTGDDSTRKFMEVLQNDFKTLSAETRKKYPQIREACDEAIEKLSLASNNPQASLYGVVNQILYPLVQGCESKDLKIIKFCLGTIQRLIAQQGIDAKGARHVVDCLYNLGQSGTVELKLLQTAALLMTTSELVHGDTLARTMVMCMRMVVQSETRDANTSHAAAATVRQLVALVFERAQAEADGEIKVNPAEVRPQPNTKAPKDLKPCAADAYLILQDIIQLINGEAPNWLVGITEIPKTFGLELLDTVLTDFAPVFFKIPDFKFLLKEHVCALIIKLFSPNVKYRAVAASPNIPGGARGREGSVGGAGGERERPHFPLSVRLLRLVAAILHRYHDLLVTECEIFLSLTIKFLDPDKPLWQRALALEVLHKMTVQPKLLTAFCACYDMKPHATNIFQDIVNALGAYVQSLFVASQINTQPGTQLAPSQPGFFWKGVWLPLCVTFEPGTAKAIYLEMLERTEAPTIQDGYGISVAYACLMEIVRAIAIVVEGPDSVKDEDEEQNETEAKEINSNTNNGVEKEASTARNPGEEPSANGHDTVADQNSNVTDSDSADDEAVKLQLIKSSWCGLVWGLSVLAEASAGQLEVILAAVQRLARCCGKMGHVSGRDACVAALCRCAVPGAREPDCRHPVVWVGAAPPHHSAGQQASFVMVTWRHVCATRALLSTARRDGAHLHHSWLPVLTSLQHLVWILGLKPSTGGCMKATRTSADASAVMSTSAVMADLPQLSTMLSQVFEASKNLDDVALHHLIDALCKLSNEAMELAYSNREPSLFAVAKLLETGLANLHRIEVIWRPITNHLLEVCQHPHIRMREWGAEAITYLVQAAFQYLHEHPEQNSDSRERLIVEPLSALSEVAQADVLPRQLECVARVLHSRGEQLRAAWPALCHATHHAANTPRAQIVRQGFQCAQLIAGDLLSACAPLALRRALAALAAYAAQQHDLNISLTAVGLMWNISDYLYHNRDKLTSSLDKEETVFAELPQHADLPYLDNMYMCLYIRLSELCCGSRAPVRRAASQTLFSCVSAHGPLLTARGWRALLHVLLPQLHQVQILSAEASAEKVDTGEHILIHHTRNTAQKQWAETQVLMLSGVARIFHSRLPQLVQLEDLDRHWAALLGATTDFATAPSHEVSIAALKSFSSILAAAGRLCSFCEGGGSRPGTAGGTNVSPGGQGDKVLHDKMWGAAWRAWASICQQLKDIDGEVAEAGKPIDSYAPTQGFLASLLQIFPVIFQHIRTTMSAEDIATLSRCVCIVRGVRGVEGVEVGAVCVPSHAARALHAIHQEALLRPCLLPALLRAYSAVAGAGRGAGHVAATLAQAAALYVTTPEPQLAGIVIQALHTAVKQCGESEALRDPEVKAEAAQIAELLVKVLETTLPLAKERPEQYADFWRTLPDVLECFMFQPPVGGGSGARQLVLSVVPYLTSQRSKPLLALLRRGAKHEAKSQDSDSDLCAREQFARTCFEALLKLSMREEDSKDEKDDDSDPLALMSLLDRFEEVLRKYSQENLPEQLPKHEISEVSFTLQALASLAEAMRAAPAHSVTAEAWDKLIGVYPSLVSLCSSTGVVGSAAGSLRLALMQYQPLLAPPS